MECTRILALRHGETAWNKDARLQGHLDIPLNDSGRWQAERAAACLQDEAISAVYASDLSRARETAEPIARVHGLPVQLHRGLRERAFGEFQGKTWQELEAERPADALAWRQRVPDFAPGGGETLLQMRERVTSTFDELAARHVGEQIVIVAHGGVLDIVYRAATRMDLQAPRTWMLSNAAINRLLWTPQGLNLVGWADSRHLDPDARDEAAAA